MTAKMAPRGPNMAPRHKTALRQAVTGGIFSCLGE